MKALISIIVVITLGIVMISDSYGAMYRGRVVDTTNFGDSGVDSSRSGNSRTSNTTVENNTYKMGMLTGKTITTFDRAGKITGKTVEDYSYNLMNKLTGKTVTTFDKAGNIISKTVENNLYNVIGKLIDRTVTTFDKAGNIISKTVENNSYYLWRMLTDKTVTTFDKAGNIIYASRATFDSKGNVTLIITSNTENTYQAGKLTRSLTRTYSNNTFTATVETLYNRVSGRSIITTTYNAGHVTSTVKEDYDGWSELISSTSETFDSWGVFTGKTVVEKTYNHSLDKNTIYGAVLSTSTTRYNAAGLIIDEAKIAYNPKTGKQISATYKNYFYDNAGKLTSIASSLYGEGNVLNRDVRQDYNAGALARTTSTDYYYYSTGKLESTIAATYDGANVPLSRNLRDYDETTGKIINEGIETPVFDQTTKDVIGWNIKFTLQEHPGLIFSLYRPNPVGPPTIQQLNSASNKELNDKLDVINSARAKVTDATGKPITISPQMAVALKAQPMQKNTRGSQGVAE